MAHPQEISVEQRQKKEHLSPLMRSKSRAQTGEKVNACPFGCGVKNLDEHGYCRHLVGFTNDGKSYEPMVRQADGRRVVKPRMVVSAEEPADEEGFAGERVMVPVLEPVLPSDKLVRITTSSRVYRDVPAAVRKAK